MPHFEQILTPLISGVSHMLNGAQVNIMGSSRFRILAQTCLVGFPSTGKSFAISVVTDAINLIESFRRIDPAISSLTHAPNNKALCDQLLLNSNLFGTTFYILN